MTENNLEDISLLKAEIERLKKAENALRESEEKYRTIFNSMDEAFCIIEMIFDAEGKPVDWRYPVDLITVVLLQQFGYSIDKQLNELLMQKLDPELGNYPP